ncbi:uncharacterized protein LOC110020075 [Phalaenopsis equestris]|uniref:uncharacterized protein LOC110020075 n=1 Tax=Phalaenopsis equestris TaxID=78828 RepID=UPI0009E4BBC8|nr:uncharacterized protein LOC110020075 [Phalaenopsis equestris]
MTANRTNSMGSEDEVYALVQRYGASTIFTLLQEISLAAEKDVTIDWRTLVKATSTGISNAQEYQMLWRHLAYRVPLEKVEDGGDPLSDESDLEFELEATPNLSEELSTEVDCCVKVILSSGAGDDCSPVALNVEAPSTTDTPIEQVSVFPSDKHYFGRYNRAAPYGAVLNGQKQLLSTGLSNEGLDGNGSFPEKKKRKLWTKEEDSELIAAVEKFGEGNWANILKGDFKHDRTASQLSQRWAIIRKRQTTSKQSNGSKARSEEMLAAQKAFSMALNMPMSGSLSTLLSGVTHSSTSIAGGTSGGTGAMVDESQPPASQASKPNPQPITTTETSSQKPSANPSNKPRTTLKKPPSPQMKPSICPNPLIKAAAFAAGLTGSSVTGTLSSSSASASTTTAATAAMTGTHALNTRFSLPPSKVSQVQSGLAKASSLPPNTSMLQQQPSSESKLASCGPHVNGKRRRSIVSSAIDVDELLAEEARGEADDKASDKLVQATDIDVSPICDGEINDSECIETEKVQNKNLKEEELREVRDSGEVMDLGDSRMDEELIFKDEGKFGDEVVS